LIGKDGVPRLDVSVEASGFSKKMAKELEAYMKEVGVDGDGDPNASRGDEDSGEEDEDESEEGEEGEEVEEEETAAVSNGADDVGAKSESGVNNEIPISALHLDDKT